VSFVSLYRKWRSQTFDEIVGQVHVTKTVKNAIEHERITHAYLFCGPRGTGKTSTARILAKALNCEKGPAPEPCNKCETCIQISAGSALDVIEIDAASNRGINEIRELREKVKYAPTKGRYKVYIIDEVHMLTKEAFNALLKTLEEPPKHVIFVLATTEPHKLLPTILSRCQRFDFKRISINDTVNHLKEISKKEHLNIEESVLNLIAGSSEGSLRDALSMLDQVISFCGRDIKLSDAEIVLGNLSEKVFLELTDCVIKQDGGTILTLTRKLIEEGKDINQLIKEFIKYFRDILVIKICPAQKGLVDRIPASIKEMEKQAKNITVPRIMNIIKLLTDLKHQFTWDTQWHIQMEITFLRMCHRAADRSPDVIEERLAELEEKIKRLPEIIHRAPSETMNTHITETPHTETIIKEISVTDLPVNDIPMKKEISVTDLPVSDIPMKEEISVTDLPVSDIPMKEEISVTDLPVSDISIKEKDKEITASLQEEAHEIIDEEIAYRDGHTVPDEQIFASALEEEISDVIPPVIEQKKTIDFPVIKKRWEDFLYRFKGENVPIYQPLIQGELNELKGNILTLSFTHSFYRDRIEDNKSKIENSLERFFGKQISLKTKLVEKKVQEISLFGEENNSPKKQSGKKESEGPTIEEATKLFEGEIII